MGFARQSDRSPRTRTRNPPPLRRRRERWQPELLAERRENLPIRLPRVDRSPPMLPSRLAKSLIQEIRGCISRAAGTRVPRCTTTACRDMDRREWWRARGQPSPTERAGLCDLGFVPEEFYYRPHPFEERRQCIRTLRSIRMTQAAPPGMMFGNRLYGEQHNTFPARNFLAKATSSILSPRAPRNRKQLLRDPVCSKQQERRSRSPLGPRRPQKSVSRVQPFAMR
jgi:hypothetical protein